MHDSPLAIVPPEWLICCDSWMRYHVLLWWGTLHHVCVGTSHAGLCNCTLLIDCQIQRGFFRKKNHQDNTPFQKENRSCFVSSTFYPLPQIWLAMHPGLTSAPELVLTSAASNQYSRHLFLASGYSSTAAGRWSPFRPKSNCSNSWGMLEGGQESLRAGGWKCGTHLSPETWPKLSPHLGSEKDSLNTVLLMSSHGVSVPLSYPIHRPGYRTFG